jgi:hypothetical protein
MSAPSTESPDQHDVIHLGGEAAVVVPMDEYRRLRALERLASAEDLEAPKPMPSSRPTGSGWPLAGRVRSRTRKRWPSCSAATGEDRVVTGGQGFRPPFYVVDDGVITIERVDLVR